MTDWIAKPTILSLPGRHITPLPDIFLRGENSHETGEEPQEIVVTRAESRARVRQRRNGSRLLRGTDRQFAEALHREADSLHYKGDYETALVLYHRAASICPRDSSHGVAARRTAAAINALSHPSKILNGLLPKVRNGAQQSAVVCPESAALRASRILTEYSDPVSIIPQILGFFDGRADFWRIPRVQETSSRRKFVNVEKTAIMSTTRIRKMETALDSGDAVTVLRIGNDVLKTLERDKSMESVVVHRYEAMTYRLITLAHVALKRHDRAVTAASKMTKATTAVNGPLLITQALVTLGKVHLTFGHLNAAARAWESLVPRVSESVPRAWLFHEIGRCYLENGNLGKALDLATKCLDTARAVDSEKWTFHGRLLLGQTLAQLGRFTEAASALRSLILAGEEAGDARTLAYVRDLAERVIRVSNCGSQKLGHPKVKSKGGEEAKSGVNLEEKNISGSSTVCAEHCSDCSSSSDRDQEELASSKPEMLSFSDNLSESVVSLQTKSPRSPKFEPSAAAGDPGDPGEQECSLIANYSGRPEPSHESISTGRTYGISSPLFRHSLSTMTTPRRRDISDCETVSVYEGLTKLFSP